MAACSRRPGAAAPRGAVAALAEDFAAAGFFLALALAADFRAAGLLLLARFFMGRNLQYRSNAVNSPKQERVMRLKRSLATLIGLERVCRVATAGARGTPHLVPVCPVVAGGKIYFGSGDDARKVRNLRENSQIAVTVDLYSDDWSQLRGAMVQGRTTLIERGPRFRRIRDRLYEKYPQYRREAALTAADSVIVEVTPTRVFSWGFD